MSTGNTLLVKVALFAVIGVCAFGYLVVIISAPLNERELRIRECVVENKTLPNPTEVCKAMDYIDRYGE